LLSLSAAATASSVSASPLFSMLRTLPSSSSAQTIEHKKTSTRMSGGSQGKQQVVGGRGREGT
jgi:hypothetical protein